MIVSSYNTFSQPLQNMTDAPLLTFSLSSVCYLINSFLFLFCMINLLILVTLVSSNKNWFILSKLVFSNILLDLVAYPIDADDSVFYYFIYLK